ncbi:MAG: hypothetical protein JXP73_19225 [Deltaproteobacteria bacterium]|nr:hypothetical protein [Deltaproteobacteria bacterium]
MDNVERTAPSQSGKGRSGTLWFLLVCSAAAMVVACLPCAGLLAQRGPTWLAVVAGLAVFPLLPLLWHGLAELRAKRGGAALLASPSRFALRSLAIALVVLGVSLGDLGPRRVVQNFKDLVALVRGKPAAKPAPKPPAPVPSVPVAVHGLESFIPADASLVVGLAGSTAMEQLLAAHGVDTRDKLAALATCKIDFVNARILIAARGRGTHMIVVRAPGITDERNLYCLVGVMGHDRLQVRPDTSGATKTLYVAGFLSRPLTFRLLDQTTVIATDESWQDTADKKLFADVAAAPEGRLALPLDRVDRTAPLWVASVDETPQGAWDLALNSRQEGNMFKLQGSSTPPSGEGDRAAISVSVPLAFARALPESAVALGIRGVVAAVVAIGASRAPAQALPPAPPPAGAPEGSGAP